VELRGARRPRNLRLVSAKPQCKKIEALGERDGHLHSVAFWAGRPAGAVSVDQDDHHETQLEQQNTAITPSNND
jgi:hypothetical protein